MGSHSSLTLPWFQQIGQAFTTCSRSSGKIFPRQWSATRQGSKLMHPSFMGFILCLFMSTLAGLALAKSFRVFEFELIIDGTYVLDVQEKSFGAEFCEWGSLGVAWVVRWICLHKGSHAHLLFDLRLVGPFSWSLANGAVFVSCGYYMLNCWNVVSYLNTISPSNGDDQIFHVATVLFASVVLCRERIGICSLSCFSSSHPMIFDM